MSDWASEAIPNGRRFHCPFCDYYLDVVTFIADRAPGCSIDETYQRHVEQIRAALLDGMRRAADAHLVEHVEEMIQLPAGEP